MSTSMRAALIAMLGPAVSLLGVVWVLINVLSGAGRDLTVRYVLFDPGHLIIVVGIVLSVICLPVAFQVAAAEPEDVELEVFEPDPARQPEERRPEARQPAWEEAARWE